MNYRAEGNEPPSVQRAAAKWREASMAMGQCKDEESLRAANLVECQAWVDLQREYAAWEAEIAAAVGGAK